MHDGARVWLDEGEAIYGGWKLPELSEEEEAEDDEDEEEEEAAEVVEVVAVEAVEAVQAMPAAASPSPEPMPSPEPERRARAKAEAATEVLLAVPRSPPAKPFFRPSPDVYVAPRTPQPAELGGWAGEMRPARGVLYDGWGTMYLARPPPSAPPPSVPDPANSLPLPMPPSDAPMSPPMPPTSGEVRPPPTWRFNSDPAAPPRSALGLRLRKPHDPMVYVPATRGSPHARLGLLDTLNQMPGSATHRRLGLPPAYPPAARADLADHHLAQPYSSPRDYPAAFPAGHSAAHPFARRDGFSPPISPRPPSPPASPRQLHSPRQPHPPRPMPEIRNALQPLPLYGVPVSSPRTPRRDKASSTSVLPQAEPMQSGRDRCSTGANHEPGLGGSLVLRRPHWGASTDASATSGGAPTHVRAMGACATSSPVDASAAAPAAIHEKMLTPLSSTRFTLREPSWAVGPTVEDLPGFTLPLKYIRGW